MGYTGLTATVFRRIPRRKRSIDMQGKRATIAAVSNGNRLNRRDYVDVSYPWPISLSRTCSRRSAPGARPNRSSCDETTYTDQETGNEVTIFYGNIAGRQREGREGRKEDHQPASPERCGQHPRLPHLRYAQRGPAAQVVGAPDATAAIEVTEAWNAISLSMKRMPGVWPPCRGLPGAKYTDADGATVALRSIPKELYQRDPAGTLRGRWARDERSNALRHHRTLRRRPEHCGDGIGGADRDGELGDARGTAPDAGRRRQRHQPHHGRLRWVGDVGEHRWGVAASTPPARALARQLCGPFLGEGRHQ